MDSLVSTDWLAQHLGEPHLVIVDSSWFMPSSGRSGSLVPARGQEERQINRPMSRR